ncbi:MAG: formylglycine-generating enzyme family protein [Lentisphaerae bacterium]|nr:formylglycine-generating enzyme family protein [Lentisphaerota bacterium]
MVWVAPGTFQMGAGAAGPDISPVHSVRITKGFWMGTYEVTQAEYKDVTGADPSVRKGGRLPVEMVSWDDAAAFCVKLTERERAAGRLPFGYEYRLPKEAEWEYAARGGAESRGYAYSGSNNPDEVAWFKDNCERTRVVGEKRPNELGLHDMSGNVGEWCLDWYDATYYGRSPGTDPVNTQPTAYRTLRGGGFDASSSNLKSTTRAYLRPETKGLNCGFRACLAPQSGRE